MAEMILFHSEVSEEGKLGSQWTASSLPVVAANLTFLHTCRFLVSLFLGSQVTRAVREESQFAGTRSGFSLKSGVCS